MTVEKIIADLKPKKCITRETLYVYLRGMKIKPLGIRQRPQQYPDDTAARILFRLGLAKSNTRSSTKQLTSKSRR